MFGHQIVGARFGMMKRSIHDARLHALGHQRSQTCLAAARPHLEPISVADAAQLGVARMYLEAILRMHGSIQSTPRLSTNIVLTEYSASSQYQWVLSISAFLSWYILGNREAAFAAHEMIGVHGGSASGRAVVAWPLDGAEPLDLFVADAGKSGRQPRDLVHDFRRMRVLHRIAERGRKLAGDFPVFLAGERRRDLAHHRDSPLAVGESAVLLEKRRTRQKHVRVFRRLIEK